MSVGRAEESYWCRYVYKFGKGRLLCMESSMWDCCNLVCYSFCDWQPMKSLKWVCCRSTIHYIAHVMSEWVLDVLLSLDILSRHAVQQCITVVQTCAHNSAWQIVCSVAVNELSNMSQWTNMIITRLLVTILYKNFHDFSRTLSHARGV